MSKIKVKNRDVTIVTVNDTDFISLTDIAKFKTNDTSAVIGNWMRNRNTIEFLGIWEILYNPGFKPLEFEGFKKEAGLNAFTLSPQKWISSTGAIGFIVKSGRYGGTFAHKDIAFKFASWISVEFELYIVKEFQRLKEEEQKLLGWSAKRELTKLNYHIHTFLFINPLQEAEIAADYPIDLDACKDTNGNYVKSSVMDAYSWLTIGDSFNVELLGISGSETEQDVQPVFMIKTREGLFAKFMVTHYQFSGTDSMTTQLQWKVFEEN